MSLRMFQSRWNLRGSRTVNDGSSSVLPVVFEQFANDCAKSRCLGIGELGGAWTGRRSVEFESLE